MHIIYIPGVDFMPVTRNYTDEQLLAHPLTKLISSIARLNLNKEFKTQEIYREIKTNYEKKVRENFPRGLNKRTVLDHLNTMHESNLDLLQKRITKNNVAYWKLKEKFTIEKYIQEEDKSRIDFQSEKIKSLPEFNLNIYGYESTYDFIDKNVKKKLDEKVKESAKKIQEQIINIQSINNYFLKTSLWRIQNNLILKRNKITKKFPKLDRRIIAFLIFSNIKNPIIDQCWEKFVYDIFENKLEIIYFHLVGFKEIKINIKTMESDPLIIINPSNELIEVLKSNYDEYKNLSREEMFSMLKDYKLNDTLSFLFINSAIISPFKFMLSPFTVVGHFSNISDILLSSNTISKVESECKSIKLNFNKHNKNIIEDLFPDNEKLIENNLTKSEKNDINANCPLCDYNMSLKKMNINDFLNRYSNDLN